MLSRPRRLALRNAVVLAAFGVGLATAAQATVFTFDTDPFAGSTALETPGRQVVAGELFIATFDFDNDVIEIAPGAFGVDNEIRAFNGLAGDIPSTGFNLIVLRTLDADPVALGNQLAAPTAANLIAARIDEVGPGFFIYFNSALGLPRLVFSTDLSSNTADLKVVARFVDQAGLPDNLERFGPQIAAVPEPATWAMMIAGFGLVGAAARRSRGPAIA